MTRVGVFDHPLYTEHITGPSHVERPARISAVRDMLVASKMAVEAYQAPLAPPEPVEPLAPGAPPEPAELAPLAPPEPAKPLAPLAPPVAVPA